MKQLKLLFCWMVFATILFSSCTKKEEVQVPGNTPPPDNTVTQATKDNYITRVYISILGREPDSIELVQAKDIISKNNYSLKCRQQILDTVLSRPEYIYRTYDIARQNLLNGTDTSQVTYYIGVYNSLLTNVTYQASWPQIQIELDRLAEMKTIPEDMTSGSLDVKGMYKRCVNNLIYDGINMGTENFVVSVFQNLYLRYPSNAELTNAKIMVDGSPSTVLLQSGKNKTDFLTIAFSANDYYEGVVRILLKRYLFREPTSDEMTSKAAAYKLSNDYKALQKDILSGNEYSGIK